MRLMPTLFRAGPYRLFVFAADCVERRHVHVDGNSGVAKFWLEPVSLGESVGYSPRETHRIRRIVERERLVLISGFDAYCRQRQR